MKRQPKDPIPHRLSIRSDEEALKLGERYFEALCTEDEEYALRHYVAFKTAVNDTRFDELRAVMGYAAKCRIEQRNASTHDAQAKRAWRKKIRPTMRWSVAATVTAVILSSAWGTIAYKRHNECVAYINGQRTTDTELVMQAMKASMAKMEAIDDEPEMETQLNDMFNTLESSDAK